jgi:hypothetical protein
MKMSEVTVLSETMQMYRGVHYYRCGFYFQKDGVRLHRKVWEDANGPVPKGMHLHHVDEDRANNQLSNLVLMTRRQHFQKHWTQERIERGRVHMAKNVIPKAALWHKDPANHDAISKSVKAGWKNRREIGPQATLTCVVCGDEYQTYRPDVSQFCSRSCKVRAFNYRKRLRSASSVTPE